MFKRFNLLLAGTCLVLAVVAVASDGRDEMSVDPTTEVSSTDGLTIQAPTPLVVF